MNDGAIVQIGTPEEIVTNPVDAYVTKFVQGINRVNLVRAETIMSPLDGRASTRKTIDSDCELGDIVDQFMINLDAVTVVDGAGSAIGMITVTEALGALRG